MRSSVGAEMMIMVIMMMGDDQDLGLDPVQRRSVFSPCCVQMCSIVYSVYSCTARRRQGQCGVCSQSQLGGSAERSEESDMRVTRGDNSDTEPGETKEHCAGPSSEYKLM